MQGQLVYPTTSGDINHHCERLLASGCTAVGMDTEWRVTYRANEAPRKTALLQVGPTWSLAHSKLQKQQCMCTAALLRSRRDAEISCLLAKQLAAI